ncbi:MAG: hypothetical protein IKJ88_07725 [Clostridia bacterium]|nr:hypothetical protein [Clostridia bacterium]
MLKEIIELSAKMVKEIVTETVKQQYPDIALQGEKVIALENYAVLDNHVYLGKQYTVERHQNSLYCFAEFPACCCPYLGEDATPWFEDNRFLPVNETTVKLTGYLEHIDAIYIKCVEIIKKSFFDFSPKTVIRSLSTKDDYNNLIAEYIFEIKSYVPKVGCYLDKNIDLPKYMEELSFTPLSDMFEPDIEQIFEQIICRFQKVMESEYGIFFAQSDVFSEKLLVRKISNNIQKRKKIKEINTCCKNAFVSSVEVLLNTRHKYTDYLRTEYISNC